MGTRNENVVPRVSIYFSICLILVEERSNFFANMLAILRFGFPLASKSLALLSIFGFRTASSSFLPAAFLTPPL